MKKDLLADDAVTHQLYLSIQKILRSLNFGKSLGRRNPAITVTQMRVLSFFNERDVIHISEISRELGMSIQSVNNIVHRLELAGYVRKTTNRQNRRFSDIRQTAKGKKRMAAFRSGQLDTLGLILGRMDPQERHELNMALGRAADILVRVTAEPGSGRSGPGEI